ncbi:MAG: MBOAT family O-acyltransferase [Peptoniphilus sp.]|nr:MBOAT family O-acyltransferase [Peptoniphilus sp.]MDD7362842.1 MBOAT family protein [Bacillota bacterium]MDY6043966.1 MBOAT family O-acyltransferase [Peptoniphilus sp.]
MFISICALIYRMTRYKWQFLLVASLVYYGLYDVRALTYLAVTIVTTYVGGNLVYRNKSKMLTFVVLLINFGMLSIVKFTDFTKYSLIIPLGISFYIFQSTSYVIDLYRRKYEPQKNIFKYALFVSFFPQIVQGPISRYDEISPMLYSDEATSFDFSHGLLLILYGYFKKLVIADRAAVLVGSVFSNPADYGGLFIFVAIIFYSIQIYCDFSGGIDIARGVAYLFGVRLAENFKRPFLSTSIGDFWRRWHITLGSWMRDYVFYPLSFTKFFAFINKKSRKVMGRRAGKFLTLTISTYVVYLIIGIWHGAGLNFIAFGFYNGTLISLALIFERRFNKWKKNLGIAKDSRWYHAFQVVRTAFLVFIGRYFTRSADLHQALELLKKTLTDWTFRYVDFGLTGKDLIIILLAVIVVMFISALQEKDVDITENVLSRSTPWQSVFILASVMVVLYFGVFDKGYTAVDFIYRNY